MYPIIPIKKFHISIFREAPPVCILSIPFTTLISWFPQGNVSVYKVSNISFVANFYVSLIASDLQSDHI